MWSVTGQHRGAGVKVRWADEPNAFGHRLVGDELVALEVLELEVVTVTPTGPTLEFDPTDEWHVYLGALEVIDRAKVAGTPPAPPEGLELDVGDALA